MHITIECLFGIMFQFFQIIKLCKHYSKRKLYNVIDDSYYHITRVANFTHLRNSMLP